MTDDAVHIQQFFDLKPARFPFLESFSLEREIEGGRGSEYTLRLRLASRGGEAARLEVTFEGVRDLRVGSLEGLLALLIDVKSVRRDQLEGLHFEVREQEHDVFSFSCSEFSWAVTEQAA